MISTHVLDLDSGMPAVGVQVKLEIFHSDQWNEIKFEKTNQDGRIAFNCEAKTGEYRLSFYIEDYLNSSGHVAFFTQAPISFKISDLSRKYHIPLLLSPFGFSTYRGS